MADDMTDGKGGIRWQFVAWVLGVLVSALVSYNQASNSFNARLSVLEDARTESARRMERIENKIDALLSRVP